MKSNQIWYPNRPQLQLLIDTIFLEKKLICNNELAVKVKFFRSAIVKI